MNTVNLQANSVESTPVREASRAIRVYHELPGLRHETKDVLQQMEANIRNLEDLGGRLGFVLAELRGLIRR